MTKEFFPPTEYDLREMIETLKSQLEDERFRDDWNELAQQLEIRKNLLQELTILNNAL